ncbi:hypothetical protein [Streptomyces olivaceus]|nr:hypothetical protein [Streptomyces olivaceus]WFB88568.1 hypothetical protein MMU79_37690 [Streptomyces olivaceus]
MKLKGEPMDGQEPPFQKYILALGSLSFQAEPVKFFPLLLMADLTG